MCMGQVVYALYMTLYFPITCIIIMVQSLSTVAAPQLENKTSEQDEEKSQDDQGILNRGTCL